MNIEITTKCPLRCPQCYCSLEGGKDICLEKAVYWLEQGAQAGVKEVELSGGETLCYPHLYDLVKAASSLGMVPNIAISGYNFTQETYDLLKESGIGGIFVSLNGSTEQVNQLSRDGYHYALDALKLLNKINHKDTYINWVMHSSNADDFPEMIKIAEEYHVENLIILGLKPNAAGLIETFPDYVQMTRMKDFIRKYRGPVKIRIETCYSPLLAMVSETKLFGNLNNGINKGCTAGLTTFNVNVDGLLSPCRHLELFERYETFSDFWQKSVTLEKIRKSGDEDMALNCENCHYKNHCRPCLASSVRNEEIIPGNRWCPVSEYEHE